MCRFILDEERFVRSQVYIPTCHPVARDEDGGSLLLCFVMCTRKVEDLCIWIYVVIFDTIAMITIFCTVVLSVIQGVALNIVVLPFSKGRALHTKHITNALMQIREDKLKQKVSVPKKLEWLGAHH
jgi:hypothetical protein